MDERLDRERVDGLMLYRFADLARSPLVDHAMFTRVGGASAAPFDTLNLGHTVGDQIAAVEENHRRALGVLGLEIGKTVSPYQVHGSRVSVVGQAHLGTVQPGCDALVTAETGVHLMLRFADCVPILFFDSARPAIGLTHAGWKGVAANIAGETVRVMAEGLGSRPRDLWAGIGPSIGPCCYGVGPEVARAVADGCPPGAAVCRREGASATLDLASAVVSQLEAAGVGEVVESGICTACRVDEFFSHRAEDGRTGRFGVVLGLTA